MQWLQPLYVHVDVLVRKWGEIAIEEEIIAIEIPVRYHGIDSCSFKILYVIGQNRNYQNFRNIFQGCHKV